MRRMLLWGMTDVEEAVFEVEEAVFEGSQRSCVVCFHFVLRCITSKEDGMVCRGFSQLKAGSQQSFNRDVGGKTLLCLVIAIDVVHPMGKRSS